MKETLNIAMILAAVFLIVIGSNAMAYVTSVDGVSGSYGAPSGTYTDTATALSKVQGPPDSPASTSGFIQIADNAVIEMTIDCIPVDDDEKTSDMILDTYDQPYPAAAKIEVSYDGSNWHQVFGKALNDCTPDRDLVYDDVCPGLTNPADTTPDASCQARVDLTQTGLSQVCHVRMTDYPASVDGESSFPLQGFDLDAIYGDNQYFDNCQPTDPPEEFPLCAGQNEDVGNVTVTNDGTNLTVTYNVNAPWCLVDAHLHVGLVDGTICTDASDPDCIPQKNGNPIPGKFDYGPTDSNPVACDTWSIDIPLASIGTGATVDDDLIIAAHAVVGNQQGDYSNSELCADFRPFLPGVSVEGPSAVAIGLNIDAIGTAIAIYPYQDANNSRVYGAPNNGTCGGSGFPTNGCLDANGGFSDYETTSEDGAHNYTFTFDNPVTEFSLRMLDYGDFNPTLATNHLVTMTAFDAANGVVDTDVLSYTTEGTVNPRSGEFDDMACPVTIPGGTGDACSAEEGKPGNFIWNVAGEGIMMVTLDFGVGHDPKIGFDTLCYMPTFETAWGNGPCAPSGSLPFPGKNWATYIEYTVQGTNGL